MKFDGNNWNYVGSPGFGDYEQWYLDLEINNDIIYLLLRKVGDYELM